MMPLLFFLLVCTEASVVRPSVESSDPHFFGKDYPLDKRPVADKHYVFDHPYPAVQDSGDFDKDFVKDENSDGGKYDAQMNYDILRQKIRKAKEKLDELKKKMEKEYEDYQHAKKDAEIKYDVSQESKKQVESAKSTAEDAIKRVNDLEGGSQADGTKTGGAVGRAIADVNKEMKDLEDCKEKLAKAKAKLKKLVKQREDEETRKIEAAKTKKAKENKEDKKEKGKSGKENEKDGKDDKEGQKDKTQSTEDKTEAPSRAEEKAERLEQEVKTDTKIASDEKGDYLKELEDVKRTEKQLEEAAKTLKKFRRPPYVDGGGGVYNVPDSHAMSGGQPNLLMMLFALITAWWLC